VCVDANAGQRAAAEQAALTKNAEFEQDRIGFYNKEVSFTKSIDANILGYSREISDAFARSLNEIGKGRSSLETAARNYFGSLSVDEGGRSRRFGKNNYLKFLQQKGEIEGVIDNVVGRNMAYFQEGARRNLLARNARAREALGVPAAYGQPIMMPPSDYLSGTLGLVSNVVSIATGIKGFFPPSDIKLKENIEQVGTSNDGYKIYEFNYKVRPEIRFRGAMAQDVVKKNPMAVSIHPKGYLTVDYNQIDIDMEVV
tara:strand:+ start:23 stop:790 length:768 start_codon:yes stop_codon:yes gene_type:complete